MSDCRVCARPIDPAAGTVHATCAPEHVPVMQSGPCARCGTVCRRYGTGGHPFCPPCREANLHNPHIAKAHALRAADPIDPDVCEAGMLDLHAMTRPAARSPWDAMALALGGTP